MYGIRAPTNIEIIRIIKKNKLKFLLYSEQLTYDFGTECIVIIATEVEK